MSFVTDKQTLDDLNILGKYKPNSIFSLFNKTITLGGERLLESMFNNPLTDVDAINNRKGIFSFFELLEVTLPFDKETFEIAENYLRNPGSRNQLIANVNITRRRLMNLMVRDEEYLALEEGLGKSIEVLSKLRVLVESIYSKAKGSDFEDEANRLNKVLQNPKLQAVYEQEGVPLTFDRVRKLDFILRGALTDEMMKLVQDVFALDVYLSVASVSKERGLVHAEALEKSAKTLNLKGVYHMAIPKAVANDICIDGEENVMFLTGANMAGKSTLMKSFSVAVYLAHMGFPIAAREMEFSVHDGIYTSINVPDNLAKGYSHFYAEVLRVKHVAEEVATDKQLLIIFDELFKGTNVKDAYDGTVAIVDAFSKHNSSFIISTHIMEAGETLRKQNERLFFRYLPTVVKGNVPTYPYILEEGITDDRQGMMIIQNEGILDIIEGKQKPV